MTQKRVQVKHYGSEIIGEKQKNNGTIKSSIYNREC